MTREKIKRIPELYKKIIRDQTQLMYLQEKAKALPTLSTEERVQTSRKNDSMKYIEAAIDLEIELNQRKSEFDELTKEAERWIGTLDTPLERRIFSMRLIDCYTWEEISELVGYSQRRIFQIKEAVIYNKVS